MNTFSLEAQLAKVIYDLNLNKNSLQILLTSSEMDAQKVLHITKELSEGFLTESDVVYIPGFFQTGVYRYESSKKIIAKRITSIHQISKKLPRIFICSVAGIARTIPTQDWIQQNKFELKLNDILDVELFLEELAKRVYIQVPRVEEIGEYSVRGSLVDFWTPGEKTPSRVEFFDDSVEKIRSFRVEDQRSFQTLQTLTVLPSREFIWPGESQIDRAIDKFNQVILNQKLMGIYRTNLLEDLRANVTFAGIDDLFYMFSDDVFPSCLEQIITLAKKQGYTFSMTCIGEYSQIEKTIEGIEKIYDNSSYISQSKNIVYAKKEFVFPHLSFAVYPQGATGEAGQILLDSPVKPANDRFKIPKNIETDLTPLSKQKFSARIEKLKYFLEKRELVNNLVFCFNNKDSLIEFTGIVAKYSSEFTNLNIEHEIKPFFAENLWNENFVLERLSDNVYYTFLNIDSGFYLPQNKSLFISESQLSTLM